MLSSSTRGNKLEENNICCNSNVEKSSSLDGSYKFPTKDVQLKNQPKSNLEVNINAPAYVSNT